MVVVVIVLVIILQNEPITTATITILTRHFIILTQKKKYGTDPQRSRSSEEKNKSVTKMLRPIPLAWLTKAWQTFGYFYPYSSEAKLQLWLLPGHRPI